MKRRLLYAIILICLSGLSDTGTTLSSAQELTKIIFSNPSSWKTHEGKSFSFTCSVVAVTHGLILSDETGFTQANIQPGIPCPASGDTVRVSGIIEFCKNGRIMPLCTSVDVLGHGRQPDPIYVSGSEFANGSCDFMPVRIVGTVLDVMPDAVDSDFDILILTCDQERIPCPTRKGAFGKLLGHRIEAVGVCIPAPPMSRQMIGRILAPTKQFSRLDDSANDCFDVPELTNSRLKQPKDLALLGRHKVHGTVLAAWNYGALVATDENLVTRLEFCDSSRPSCGDEIEASGLPETDIYSPILRRAKWRKTTPMRQPIPKPEIDVPFLSINIDARRDKSTPHFKCSNLHGKVIRTKAKVRSLPSKNGFADYMLVGTDELSIPVDISSAVPHPPGLEVGSEVEISGIYLLECQPWRPNVSIPPIDSVRIIARSADDIRTLSTPPWWTASRLLVVMGILFGCLILILIWNLSLRRLAEQRGQKLSDERIARAEAEIKTMERTRLAVELHDTIAQNLTGVSIALDTARQFCQTARPELMQQIDVADATLDSCQTELRNCLWDLRNLALEQTDLNTAIRTALLPHVNNAALDIRFNVDRDRLTENTTHAILRIIRELVINAIRHGHATHIQIAGALDPDALHFSVRDNGCGFDADTCPGVAQKHFGLQGVRERLSSLGGRLSIKSTHGSGSRIVTTIPLPGYQNFAKSS